MKKINKFSIFVVFYLALTFVNIFAKPPYIYVKTQSNEIYESIFLTHCDSEGNESHLLRYENYYNLRFNKDELLKIDNYKIKSESLYYFFIKELAIHIYNLSCKIEMGLANNTDINLKYNYENQVFKYLCQCLNT